MSRRLSLPLAAVVAAVVAGVLAGCGGPPGDLLAVDRYGDVPGARLRLVVEDGGEARCNRQADRRMPDQLLLDARELQRNLDDPAVAGLNLPARPQSVLRYDVQTPDSRVRFADDSRGAPAALDRLALFVRRVAQEVCGLAR